MPRENVRVSVHTVKWALKYNSMFLSLPLRCLFLTLRPKSFSFGEGGEVGRMKLYTFVKGLVTQRLVP